MGHVRPGRDTGEPGAARPSRIGQHALTTTSLSRLQATQHSHHLICEALQESKKDGDGFEARPENSLFQASHDCVATDNSAFVDSEMGRYDVDEEEEEKKPCASCVWTAKLFPFVFALWAGNEFRSLPRGHPNRRYVGVVGGLMLATGIWFNTLYVFEGLEEQKLAQKN